MLAGCESVELAYADVLHNPGGRIEHVYFPTTAFISLIMPVGVASSLEVGLVGDEGMFGIPLVLGVDVSPRRAIVQGAGSALRMDAVSFRRELRRSKGLLGAVNRYAFVHLHQLAQTAGCTHFHLVEERLARWLLMTQDRAHSDTFHITHEFLSAMLGVRRAGVTTAALALQSKGLITYHRGHITVVSRRGLKAISCDCYKADRESYNQIFGRGSRRATRFA
jgi:hypothetical protein